MKPTQADREAAAEMHAKRHKGGVARETQALMRKGAFDHGIYVQAFCAHRIAALEEAAKIAEAEASKYLPGGPMDMKGLFRGVAARIRSLIPGDTDMKDVG